MVPELGARRVRTMVFSPGPIPDSKAASSLPGISILAERSLAKNPMHRLVTTEQVGRVVSYFVSPGGFGSNGIVVPVDAGESAIA